MTEEKKTAGRKPLPANEKKRQVNFYLTHEEETKMREGLKSIRQLIAREMETETK